MRVWHFTAGIFHLISFLTFSDLFKGNGVSWPELNETEVVSSVFSALIKHLHTVDGSV